MRIRNWSRGIVGLVIGGLGAAYIWFFYRTTRWTRHGQEHVDAILAENGFIACCWHARLFPVAMLRPGTRRVKAMISSNRDGEIVARALAAMGVDAIRGSSQDPRKPDVNRGGAGAMQDARRSVQAGDVLAITPDGPRGPLMRVKPGVAWVAIAAQAPVLPIAYSTKRAKIFKSWDRFMFPWPFNTGALVFGKPLYPPTSLDDETLEGFRAEIEARLYAATVEADRHVGRNTPEQGPPLNTRPSASGAGLSTSAHAQEHAQENAQEKVGEAARPEAEA